MCKIDRSAEQQILNLGLTILCKTIDNAIIEPKQTDVLAVATNAYQQGKITKANYLAIIDALDNNPVHQEAWSSNSSQNALVKIGLDHLFNV
jgi:hypothetical protein